LQGDFWEKNVIIWTKIGRKIYRISITRLIERKLNKNRSRLCFWVRGRQGNTWLIQEFGKNEYKQMVYVNFEDEEVPRDIFQTDFNIDRIITLLNAYAGLKITTEVCFSKDCT
jgi:hypothetical protein